MGLTPLTRRRLADAWAGVILLVVFSGSAFITGYGLGYTQRPTVYRCPQIEGAKPITTINSTQGQTCVYVQHDKVYGRATARVKL